MQDAIESLSKINEYHFNHYQANMPRFSLYELDYYLKKYDKKRRKFHSENYYQIIWFKKGKGTYFCDYKRHDINGNTLFFVSKERVHYFDKEINYNGILIQFNDQFLIHDNDGGDFFLRYNLFSSFYPPYVLPSDEDSFILDEYLDLFKNELTKRPYGQIDFIRNYLKVFLIQLKHQWNKINTNQGQQILPDDKKQLKLVRFLNLIEDNFKNGINVSQYAALMDISSRTLSELTRQMLDKSPSELIHQRIIAEAKKMLLDTNYSINKIGCSLGFKDDSYFVKYFKKHTDISPLDFRRQHF
ncbi:AraC family transcriptional regulator [Flavobacterium flavigenum]|uniref:AraC family transcriptional regulator n=1 Tax=Flavobacterium flavigenum TaxID=3003258 RepID=UPI002482757F|nr:AraC family transcriptional regulator [Flavobacterium flavigenum]